MKYDVTYACGHTGVIELVGKKAEREWRLERAANSVCPACMDEQRAAQAEKDAEEAERKGMPKLTGSEKQIIWAEQLRAQMVRLIDDYFKECEASYELYAHEHPDDAKAKSVYDSNVALVRRISASMMVNMTRASEWIDQRIEMTHVERFLRGYYAKHQAAIDATDAETKEQAVDAAVQAKAEATIRPDLVREDGVAVIELERDDDTCYGMIRAKHTINDKFREIVKGKGYIWDRDAHAWVRNIGVCNGCIDDRAAELMVTLLLVGFVVRCSDDEVRRRAKALDFEPEYDRWIKRYNDDWLKLVFPKNDALYALARKLKGSKWSSSDRCVIVPVTSSEALEEFARLEEFRATDPGAGDDARLSREHRAHDRRRAQPPAGVVEDQAQGRSERHFAQQP